MSQPVAEKRGRRHTPAEQLHSHRFLGDVYDELQSVTAMDAERRESGGHYRMFTRETGEQLSDGSEESTGSGENYQMNMAGHESMYGYVSGSGSVGASGGAIGKYEPQRRAMKGARPMTIRPRSSANARERDRTHSVNSAFVTLRTMIPTEPADRKLSKIETLRLATSYISHLHTILMVGMDCIEQPCIKHQAVLHRGIEAKHIPVCTFCLSASKHNRSQPMRHESCMYRDSRTLHLAR